MKIEYISSLLFTFIVICGIHINYPNYKLVPQNTVSVPNIPAPNYLFGIVSDSLVIERNFIKPNMFLSTLLSEYHISSEQIGLIIEKTKNVFDVRKIKRGQPYTGLFSNDTLKQLKYLIYEPNAVDYVVFDLTNEIKVYTGSRTVQIIEKQVTGVINSNLWGALQEKGVNPLLSNNLSEIYAWTVDFFGIQKGDSFNIIYEEKFVENQSIGLGKIKSALFYHYGKSIYAIPFTQDSIESYYDLDGTSLKRSFLKAPLEYSRISSGFSNARLHPILKKYQPHHGVDYSAPVGTPVRTIGDGTVLLAQFGGKAGFWIKIRHNNVYQTAYLHLSKFAPGIVTGARVIQGQIIGYVGSTGLSTGPHLDFRVWQNEQAIDPLKIEAPPVEPIKPENKAAFEKARDIWMTKLLQIKLESFAR